MEAADFHLRQESDLTHPDNAIKIQSIHKQFNTLFSLALIFKSRHVVSPYKHPDTENWVRAGHDSIIVVSYYFLFCFLRKSCLCTYRLHPWKRYTGKNIATSTNLPLQTESWDILENIAS